MRNLVILIILGIGLAVARAQIGPSGSGQNMLSTSATGPKSTTPIGPGLLNNSKITAASATVGTCNGVIDLSTGCVQPMFGVM